MFLRRLFSCIAALLVSPTVALAAAAKTPTFSPAGGTYATQQTVSISDGTPGARIYYTTNGTTPTTRSALYAGPIAVSATTTIKALATASGYTNSTVASATYTMVAATPTFSPAGGTYATPQTVSLSDATPGAKIYYTTNGTTPTTSSTLYSTPISVTATTTIKALATATGYTNSAVASAAFTISLPRAAAPVFSPLPGTYTGSQAITLTSTTPGSTIFYTTDGTAPTSASNQYTSPVIINHGAFTIRAVAQATNFSRSTESSGTYAADGFPPFGSGITVSARGSGTVSTDAFSTIGSNFYWRRGLLLAFVSSTGPALSAQSATISGGGLSWSLAARANAQAGTSEVWVATLDGPKTGISVVSTPAFGGYSQLLTVVELEGSDWAFDPAPGNAATASGGTGTPGLSIATSGVLSFVFGVGNDSSTAAVRSVGAGQTILSEFSSATDHSDHWVQRFNSQVPLAGSSVGMATLGPVTDSWNFAAIEVRRTTPPAGGVSPRGSYPGPVWTAPFGGPEGSYWMRSDSSCWYPWPTWSVFYEPEYIASSREFCVALLDYSGSTLDSYNVDFYLGSGTGIELLREVNEKGIGQVQTRPISTDGYGGRLLLALVYAEGPRDGIQEATVSSEALNWTLLQRANAQQGTAEVWAAWTDIPLTLVPVRSELTRPEFLQSVSVYVLDGATTGASLAASGSGDAPSLAVPASAPGSWFMATGTAMGVYAQGPSGQLILQGAHSESSSDLGGERLESWHGWVQWPLDPGGPQGSSLALANTGGQRWNMAGVEVRSALPVPTLAPLPGAYPGGQMVTLSVPVTDVTIYYTTDGTIPTKTSPIYRGPFLVNADTTVRAMASSTGLVRSDIATGTYTIPVPSSPGGAVSAVLASAQGTGTVSTQPLFTTGEGRLMVAFVASTGPAGTPQTMTVTNLGSAPLTWSLLKRANQQQGTAEVWVGEATAPLSGVVVQAVPSLLGFHSSLTVVSVTGVTTTTGSSAAASGSAMGGPSLALTPVASGSWLFAVVSDTDQDLHLAPFAGLTVIADLSDQASGELWIEATSSPAGAAGVPVSLGASSFGAWNIAAVEVRLPPAPSPSFSPPPGAYTAAQQVSLSNGISGSAYFYSTDGTIPTESSLGYQGPIALAAATTLQAMTSAGGGYSSSAVASGDYVVCPSDACVSFGISGTTCVPTHAPATTSCDDANPCTAGDHCNGAGACVGAGPAVIEDFNLCTLDSCDPARGIAHTAVASGTPCSDGNVCNGLEICNGTGSCQAGVPPRLDDGDSCTADACSSSTGITHTPIVGCNTPPPNPSSIASAVNLTAPTDLAAAIRFLYSGDTPVQYGVAAEAMDPLHVAVITGRVLQRAGTAFVGATVSILGHPEFGHTRTRDDGRFDIAVNGRGRLTVDIQAEGYLPLQRQIETSWRAFHSLPDVTLVPFDTIATPVALGAGTAQAASSTVVTDERGSRRASFVFAPGTGANLRLADGSTRPLSGQIHVRATEYTVGSSGPSAMPGDLPPTSGYTYAVELSVDEAVVSGASSVEFNQPVAIYVDNFLHFPVGTPVPSGYYDRARAEWVPSKDGVVVDILSIGSGMALLDANGDGVPDDDASLATRGITIAERQILAGMYAGGQSLWRVPVTHFTPYDLNWPILCATTCAVPQLPPMAPGRQTEPDLECGSIIDCQNQALGEEVAIAGTPYSLRYTSLRSRGRKIDSSITIPLVGPTVPAGLERVAVGIAVAGNTVSATFVPTPNLSYPFTWNGLDRYGRRVQGTVTAQVVVGYGSPGVYADPSGYSGVPSFALSAGGASPLSGSTTQLWSSKSWPVQLGGLSAESAAMGGWLIDRHHTYDPGSRALYLGSGFTSRVDTSVITTVAGLGRASGSRNDGGSATKAMLIAPTGMAFLPDGSFLIADWGDSRVRRVDRAGIISTVAGGAPCSNGGTEGVPATDVCMSPIDVAVAKDGTWFIADAGGHKVWRVDQGGRIRTFAGGGQADPGNGGPATDAKFGETSSVAVGPDGAVYVLEGTRLRRVGTDGIVSTIAGEGTLDTYGSPVNDVPARLVTVPSASTHAKVSVASDGGIYIGSDVPRRMRRIGPDGLIRTVAGFGTSWGVDGDGGPATQAHLGYAESWANNATPEPGGGLLIADNGNTVREVAPDGIIRHVAGSSRTPYCTYSEGGPAASACFGGLAMAVRGPDGAVYVVDYGLWAIRKISSGFPAFTGAAFSLPSQDGSEVYHFDAAGRHLWTSDARTAVTTSRFAYDSGGRLTGITDHNGQATLITRDADGAPTAIIAPSGLQTRLTSDAAGYLSSITNPAGERIELVHDGDGLLQRLRDARGQDHTFSYDSLGRLTRDAGPAGGTKSLSRTDAKDGYSIAVTSALGRVNTYGVSKLGTGDTRRTRTRSDGAISSTLELQDGTAQVTYPDGTVATEYRTPDPRFGMQAPLKSSTTVTPSGLSHVVSSRRSVAYANASQPSTPTSVSDFVYVDDNAYSSVVDLVSRRVSMYSPGGRFARGTYDAYGRPVTRSVGVDAEASIQYDGAGHVSSITQGTRTFSFSYDSQGWLQGVTDPLLRTHTFTRDGVGRVTSATLPGPRTVAFAYDANGNATAVTPPGGLSHLFTFTANDQVETYNPPFVAGSGLVSTHYAYDSDGALAQWTNPDLGAVVPGYDVAGRLTSVTTERGTSSIAYDSASRVGSVTTPEGQGLVLGYDGPLPTSSQFTGSVRGVVARAFDRSFRVTSISVNGANTGSLSYDSDSLLKGIGNLIITRDTSSGRVRGTTHGVVQSDQDYSQYGELSLFNSWVSNSAIYSYSFVRDDIDRITSKVEKVQGVSHTFNYSYDPAGRLASVTKDGALVETYSYDDNGNRLSGTTSTGTGNGTYDDQDRMTAYGAAAYTYGPTGDMRTRTVGGQTTTYSYDALGNLMGVWLPDGRVIEYVPDGLNRRVGKKVNGSLVEGFLYDGQLRPVAWLNGAGQVYATFAYGLHVNVPEYMTTSAGTFRILTDHLGSPRLVVNTATGAVAQRMDYDAFGQVLADTSPGFQPFGFAGGLWDRDTGLVRFGARDYDASTGRWTNKDPLGLEGGLNVYEYVGNDPNDTIDPTGLSPADVQKILAQFNKSVQEMTKAGLRTDPGALNNFLRGLNNISFGKLGHHFLGCGEQALALQEDELALQLDDWWTFELTGSNLPQLSSEVMHLGPHWWLTATSTNPADPRIILDPWGNSSQIRR